jgi:hypothetical protein
VKLPGASQWEPNVYDFGTSYADIYEDLRQKNEDLYARKGLLQVLTFSVVCYYSALIGPTIRDRQR